MKRFLISLLVVQMAMTVLLAQQPIQRGPLSNRVHQSDLRAISDYPVGFSYVRRDQSISKSITVGSINNYLVSGMKLPALAGAKITHVHFVQSSDAETGKVAILEITEEGINEETQRPFHKAKVVFQKDVTLNRNQVTSCQLADPFEMQPNKAYVVAYEVRSSAMASSVLAYDGLPNPVTEHYAKFLTQAKVPLVTDEAVLTFEEPKERFGAPLIFVEMDGLNNRLDHMVLPVGVKIAEETSAQQDCLPEVWLYNYGTGAIANVEITSTLNDKTENHQLTELSFQPYMLLKKSINLGKLSTGFYHLFVTVPKINGQANSYGQYATETVRTSVIDPSHYEKRKEILLERFSTEKCGNCPAYDLVQDEVVNELRGLGYQIEVIVHHAGYIADWLQLLESKEIEPYFYAGGALHAPAVALNRTFFPGINPSYPNDIAQGPNFMRLKAMAEQSSDVRRAVRIDRITRSEKQTDDSYNYTIEVTTTPGVDYNDLYVSAVLLESGIPARQQAGATGEYVHDHTVRKFLTPAKGRKLSLAPGTAEIVFENVKMPNVKKPERCRLVVFFHQAIDAAEIGQRTVYASMGIAGTEVVHSNLLAPEEQPHAYVAQGRVCVAGPAERFEIYTLDGVRLADSYSVLPTGSYVVVIYWNGVPYSSKVVVR